MRTVTFLGIAALALVACSGDDGESGDVTSSDAADVTSTDGSAAVETAAPADTPAPDESSPETELSSSSTSATDAPTTEPTTTPPPTTTPVLPGFEEVIALGVEPGIAADRPVLTWDTVDGADHYGVYVYAPSGEIYWAWRGRDTSVPLGGDIGDAPGPAVADGMSWAVIAYDRDLLPVAVSATIPLTST